MRLTLVVPALLVSAVFAGGAALAQSAAPSPAPSASSSAAIVGDAAHGKALFADNCAACHGAKGEGGVGPALQGEKDRKSAAEISAQIMDPAPPMPKLYPNPLSKRDVADLTAFVRTL